MKLLNKFKYAFTGLFIGMRQGSIWLQIVLGLVAVVTFIVVKISYFEWLVVIIMIAIVVLCEWINSIVEMTVDYISLERKTQAKKIKDLSAGLVLLSGLFALIIGILLLIEHLL